MPMVPEAVVAMLSCARLGAIHSVVFAGFSANSLSDRINDSGAKVIITSDGNYRGNKIIPVKKIVDQAIQKTNSIETVIVLNRTNMDVSMNEDRDFWYDEIIKNESTTNKAETMDSEDPLFILYTSGSTGSPRVYCTLVEL